MDEIKCCCEEEENGVCPCRYRTKPRSDDEKKTLQTRLNRIIGQLGGIKNMVDDNRYCGDILIQVSAVEKALRSFGCVVMKSHLESCVAEQVRNGNDEIMDEVMELFKRLS